MHGPVCKKKDLFCTQKEDLNVDGKQINGAQFVFKVETVSLKAKTGVGVKLLVKWKRERGRERDIPRQRERLREREMSRVSACAPPRIESACRSFSSRKKETGQTTN